MSHGHLTPLLRNPLLRSPHEPLTWENVVHPNDDVWAVVARAVWLALGAAHGRRHIPSTFAKGRKS